jgi:hypothetical protein
MQLSVSGFRRPWQEEAQTRRSGVPSPLDAPEAGTENNELEDDTSSSNVTDQQSGVEPGQPPNVRDPLYFFKPQSRRRRLRRRLGRRTTVKAVTLIRLDIRCGERNLNES